MRHDISIEHAKNGWIISVPYDLYKSHKAIVATNSKELIEIIERVSKDMDTYDR